MSSKVPTTEELLRLRDLTRMTGCLTNAQTVQLKMWPQVILGARNAEVEFDPDGMIVITEIGNIDYDTIFEGVASGMAAAFRRRMERFNEAVKFLLGEEYTVIVKMAGVVLGEYPATSMPRKAHEPEFGDGRNRKS